MANHLILMAYEGESQGLFENAALPVYFTGLGKVNAALKTTELILKLKPELVLNFGTAGSRKFKTHDLVECSSFIQRDMDLSPLGIPVGTTAFDPHPAEIKFTRRFRHLPDGKCGTGDNFEMVEPKMDYDLVDMEAFAIAKVCLHFNIECCAVKYITDGADSNSSNDWKLNLKKASERLFYEYHQFIKRTRLSEGLN